MSFWKLFKRKEDKTPKNTREKGFLGEDEACLFLEKQGYFILCRNFTSPCGEIDIIMRDDRYIAFVEVKTREEGQGELYGRPAAAVTKEKQRRIIKTAKFYKNPHKELIPRFDVVEVYKNSSQGRISYRFNHITSAFDLTSSGIKRY